MRRWLPSCAMFVLIAIFSATTPAHQDDQFEEVFTNARKLAMQKRFDDAIKEFKKAAGLRNDECADCYRLIGEIYFQMRKYRESAAAYRQALGSKPSNEADLTNWLGVALYLQDDKKVLDEAAAAFRRAIDLSGGKIVTAYYNLGYTLMKQGKEEEGVEAFKSYLEVSPGAVNAAEVRTIMTNPKMAREKFAPGFKVKSTEGMDLSLDGLRGKVVLLDFWATWCGPCRVEMPEVKKVWKKYGGDQFIIVGVSLDGDRGSFESYVRSEGLTWPQYFDGGGWGNKIARLYNVSGIPDTVLIDHDGIIRARGLRGGALYSKIGDLIKKIPNTESAAEGR